MDFSTSTMTSTVHDPITPPQEPLEYEYETKPARGPPIRHASLEIFHQNAQSHTTLTLSLPTTFLLLSLLLIFTLHLLLRLSLASSILAFSPLAYLIHHDYQSFLSLGPGGTPSTFAGYLRITYLRLYALSDPLTPPPRGDAPLTPNTGYWAHTQSTLPLRHGPRPTVEGLAPQRQRTAFSPLPIYLSLRRSWILSALSAPSSLETKKSCFEKQGLALFAKEQSRVNETCNGEIAHVHAVDGSFHMSLHPDDVAVLIERGWGQRHPLAGCGPAVVRGRVSRRLQGWARGMGWRGTDGEGRAIVPSGFVLVYAPRTEEELEIVKEIVKASAWWVMGRVIELRDVSVQEVMADLGKARKEAGVKDDDHVPGFTALAGYERDAVMR